VVFGRDRDAGALVGLEHRQVDHVPGVDDRLQQIVRAAGIVLGRAPVQPRRAARGRGAAQPTACVLIAHIRECVMERIVELVDPQTGGIPDGDIRLRHAHLIHQLVEQGEHQLRRVPDRAPGGAAPTRNPVIIRVGAPIGVRSGQVHLDVDLLPGLIASAAAIEGAEDGIPGRGGRGGVGIAGQRPLQHGSGLILVHVVEPALAGIRDAVPVSDQGVVRPGHAARRQALGRADGTVGGVRLIGQQRSLGGLALAECRPAQARCSDDQRHSRGQVARLAPLLPRSAQGQSRAGSAGEPDQKAARQRCSHLLAGIGSAARLGNNPDEEPHQCQKAHQWEQDRRQLLRPAQPVDAAGLGTLSEYHVTDAFHSDLTLLVPGNTCP